MAGSDLVAFTEDKHPMWLMLYRAKDLLRPGSVCLWDELFLEDLGGTIRKPSLRCCTIRLSESHNKPLLTTGGCHWKQAHGVGGGA